MFLLTFHYDFENHSSQNLMRLLMFDELVITISAELKSGFQFNHVINNKSSFKPDQLMMHDEKTNTKLC